MATDKELKRQPFELANSGAPKPKANSTLWKARKRFTISPTENEIRITLERCAQGLPVKVKDLLSVLSAKRTPPEFLHDLRTNYDPDDEIVVNIIR